MDILSRDRAVTNVRDASDVNVRVNDGDAMEHFGQCTCVYVCLGNIINEDIIFLIDGYVHMSEYVETAIAAALFDQYRNTITGKIKPPQTEIIRRLKLYNGVTKLWRFGGDENCAASILIDGVSTATKIPISGDATVCTISLGPDSSVEVRVNNILLNQFFDLTWDGADLTPFSRRRRRYIKSAVAVHDIYDPGQKNDPVDVMCNVAHAAIWTWFHGGGPADYALPRPTKIKNIAADNILADYYDHAVKKMYRNDDRFQRPHRKTNVPTKSATSSAAITGGIK